MGDPYSLAKRRFPVRCPKCRKTFEERLRRMDGNHDLLCPGCHFEFKADGSHLIEDVTKALDEFMTTLEPAGKA